MSLTGSVKGKTLHGNINRLYELRGYSAYEVAVLNGFVGTVEDWQASLKGDKGDKGDTGENYQLTEADKEEIAGMVAVPPAVLYTEQSLTEEQQEQVRKNIGLGLDQFIIVVEFAQGTISGSSGNVAPAGDRVRSNYFSIAGLHSCIFNTPNFELYGHFYDAESTYLGNTGGWLTSLVLSDYTKTTPAISQMRLVARYASGDSITPADVEDQCWLTYKRVDLIDAKIETVTDLGSKDVFALSTLVIYENSYHDVNGDTVDQEGCSVYRLYLGDGNEHLFGKTIKIKTYAYGDMAYGFDAAVSTLINPDANVTENPESGVCEFEVTLPEYDAETSSLFFHVSFCENAYTGLEIYEKKGTVWEEIKALWVDVRNDQVQFEQLWNEIDKLWNEIDKLWSYCDTVEAYDGTVTVE